MLIRSQNKKSLVNMDNIDTINCYSTGIDFELIAYNVNTEICLGSYSTEYKAIKVLDMIEKKYLLLNSSLSGVGSNGVFQMPEDKDVY